MIARIYDSIRTAQLERLVDTAPAVTIHRVRNYDYDPDLAARHSVRQMSRLQIFRWILRARPETIETNEPLQVNAWPTLVAVHLARMLIFGDRRPKLVFYAIENADVVSSVAGRLHLPKRAAAVLVRFLGGTFQRNSDRICFGTSDAEQNYRDTLGVISMRSVSTTIESLPCAADELSSRSAGEVLFLGAFEARKGLGPTLEALDRLAERRAGLTFRLIGKGPLLPLVSEFVATREWASLSIDPPRTEVFEALRRASTLVLFSQPTPRWREQVGLPIVEALSHGLEVVASSETGLARWLRANGHHVLSPDASIDELASAVAEALDNRRTASDVVLCLPDRDSRLLADDWLFA